MLITTLPPPDDLHDTLLGNFIDGAKQIAEALFENQHNLQCPQIDIELQRSPSYGLFTITLADMNNQQAARNVTNSNTRSLKAVREGITELFMVCGENNQPLMGGGDLKPIIKFYQTNSDTRSIDRTNSTIQTTDACEKFFASKRLNRGS